MSGEKFFDTLKYANRLKAAGVPEKQAEVQAELQAEIIEERENRLATKKDVALVTQELILEIKLVEERINKNIAQMGYRIIFGLGAGIGSMLAISVTILGYIQCLK